MGFGQVDADAPDAARELATGLQSVARRAGYAGVRELANGTNVGRSTVSDALTARRVPTWAKLAALLRGCGVAPDAAWARAHEAARSAVEREKLVARGAAAPGASGNGPVRTASSGPGTFSIRAPYGELPPRVRGREELIGRLEAGLDAGDGRLRVLHGLGGCGKTTVALHLARQARDRGHRVFWLSSTSPDRLVTGMREVAGELGVDEGAIEAAWTGRTSATDLVWGALDDARQPWLLVVDNVDEPHRLASGGGSAVDATGWIRPSRAGMTVVTSRVGSPGVWGHEAETHRVGVLVPEDGRDVLLDLAGDAGDPADALVLAERLGGLPLALRLAGSYLARSARGAGLLRPRGRSTGRVRSFATYVKALDEGGARFLDLGERQQVTEADTEDMHRRLISRTWELSLDLLEEQQLSEARSLMRLLSCGAPAPFPVDLLGPDVLAEIGADLRLEPEAADRALEALIDLSLIDAVDIAPTGGADEREPITCLVSHRLVLEANASRLAESPERDRVGVWRALARILETGARPAPELPRNWPWWRLLAPHVRHALTDAPDDLELLRPLVHAGLAAYAFHNFSKSYESAEELARLFEQRCAPIPVNDPIRLSVRHRVALSLLSGEVELREYESILAEQIPLLGDDHPESLITRFNLVMSRLNNGRMSETDVEAELRAILHDRRQALGPDDPYTLLTHGTLAGFVESRRHDHEGVNDEYAAMVAHIRSTTPDDHRFLSLHNRHQMAHALDRAERWDEAEKEYRSVLAELEESEMQDSELSRDMFKCLAENLRNQKRYPQALDAIDACLGWFDGRAPERSTTSPAALFPRHLHGHIVGECGRLAEAEREMRDVLTERLLSADPTDSLVLADRHCLAHVLERQERYDEAYDELRDVAESYVSVLGPSDNSTRNARMCLAYICQHHGDRDEAVDLYLRVLDAEIAELGEEHTDTLHTRFHLEVCRYDAGVLNVSEAREAYERILAGQTALVGADHWRVTAIRDAVAGLPVEAP